MLQQCAAVTAAAVLLLLRTSATAVRHRRVRRLGLILTGAGKLDYAPDETLALEINQLVMIPHGKTPSNVQLLFQSHVEGPDARLLPASLDDAAIGAARFVDEWGERLKQSPDDFVFFHSPLHRTTQTAAVYVKALQQALSVQIELSIESRIIEIDHASWHGKTAGQLQGTDQEEAAAYRNGDIFAAPGDGECLLDVLERSASWLRDLSDSHKGKTVVVFGHGTYQNCVETLLCSYGADTKPSQIFTRQPGMSHLIRGSPHVVYPPKLSG